MKLKVKLQIVSSVALLSCSSQSVMGMESASLVNGYNTTRTTTPDKNFPKMFSATEIRKTFEREKFDAHRAKPMNGNKRKADAVQGKPNILLIMADDVGTGDIPFYWNSGLVDMPNIKRLAGRGVTFTDAYATPLCSPSRYVLLSGNYQHRGEIAGGTWNIKNDHNQFANNQKSIAQALKDGGGYRTHMSGKWHIGAKVNRKNGGPLDYDRILSSSNHDWTKSLGQGPQDIGFDASLISLCGIQAKPYAFFRDGYLQTKMTDVTYWEKGSYNQPKGESIIKRPGEGDINWDSTAYNQIVVEDTLDFINNHIKTSPDQPFFSYVALGAVHGPHSPPDTYLDQTPVKGTHPTPHMDMLLEMDLAVGTLIDTIDSSDLTSNTLIIFTSDNGGIMPANGSIEHQHYSSGPLRDAKGSIYEGGTRVPMVFSWPGTVPTGKILSSSFVGLSDIYATLSEIAGVNIPDGSAQDSTSFAKLLYHGQDGDETQLNMKLRKWMPTWVYNPQTGFRSAEAIRRKNMKAIRFFDSQTGRTSQELYDLDADPSETTNLANDPAYKQKKRSLLRKLRKLGPCPGQYTKSFILQNGPEKGAQVTCDFFDSVLKCQTYVDGELKCPDECSRRVWQCSQ